MLNIKKYLLVVLTLFIIGCGGSSSSNTANTVTSAEETNTPTNEGKPNVIVIFTDDMGYADIGIQNQHTDIKTPYIDSIATNGAKMTHGYVTAPQCTPSRAAMITGRYQQRFGVDDTTYSPMPLDIPTLGEHFKTLGYATGMVGKWHLEIEQGSSEWIDNNYPNTPFNSIPLEVRKKYFPNNRGYTDTYFGYLGTYWTTFDIQGNQKEESYIKNSTYRIDTISDAAVSFIHKNHSKPFYLHVAPFAPHVPLEATQTYLDRFPDVKIERRKYALAMISAVDDGVGRILNALEENQILDNTLLFFISDNGAPLGLDMSDVPANVVGEAWDGSVNTPWVGEKGMLTEGGIRVPFLIQWPKKIPAGLTVEQPVITLDAAYSALKAAGASDTILNQLDGVDILPALTSGSVDYLGQRVLFWRFWGQSAVRLGQWKYIRAGSNREYLFDLSSTEHEHSNLITSHPQKAQELKKLLQDWEQTLLRQVENPELNSQEVAWYDYFL